MFDGAGSTAVNGAMKIPSKLVLSVIVTALACLLVPSPAFAADTGELTIKRSPKFGAHSVLDVFVDGNRVDQLHRGKSYTASLPAGTHEVKVHSSVKKAMSQNQATKQVTVEAGKTTTLTASWDGGQLVLR
jgi:hypothetical protein